MLKRSATQNSSTSRLSRASSLSGLFNSFLSFSGRKFSLDSYADLDVEEDRDIDLMLDDRNGPTQTMTLEDLHEERSINSKPGKKGFWNRVRTIRKSISLRRKGKKPKTEEEKRTFREKLGAFLRLKGVKTPVDEVIEKRKKHLKKKMEIEEKNNKQEDLEKLNDVVQRKHEELNSGNKSSNSAIKMTTKENSVKEKVALLNEKRESDEKSERVEPDDVSELDVSQNMNQIRKKKRRKKHKTKRSQENQSGPIFIPSASSKKTDAKPTRKQKVVGTRKSFNQLPRHEVEKKKPAYEKKLKPKTSFKPVPSQDSKKPTVARSKSLKTLSRNKGVSSMLQKFNNAPAQTQSGPPIPAASKKKRNFNTVKPSASKKSTFKPSTLGGSQKVNKSLVNIQKKKNMNTGKRLQPKKMQNPMVQQFLNSPANIGPRASLKELQNKGQIGKDFSKFKNMLQKTLERQDDPDDKPQKDLPEVGKLGENAIEFSKGVDYEKYKKMQKMRMPEGAIRNAMTRDGLADVEIENFFKVDEEDARRKTLNQEKKAVYQKKFLEKMEELRKEAEAAGIRLNEAELADMSEKVFDL
eukprot:augustus_masked-scaffold_23-processed-gene-4.45-mRNA-1 protein AED:1.00 eAED:1.00 QI:0/-1/0/0/-1/1/1/0/579